MPPIVVADSSDCLKLVYVIALEAINLWWVFFDWYCFLVHNMCNLKLKKIDRPLSELYQVFKGRYAGYIWYISVLTLLLYLFWYHHSYVKPLLFEVNILGLITYLFWYHAMPDLCYFSQWMLLLTNPCNQVNLSISASTYMFWLRADLTQPRQNWRGTVAIEE